MSKASKKTAVGLTVKTAVKAGGLRIQGQHTPQAVAANS